MNQKIALILAPPFWPNLPPLSLISLASFLDFHSVESKLFDLNNKIFNLSDDSLKKEWLISANKPLEDKMLHLLKTKFKKQITHVYEQLLTYDIAGFSCFRSNFLISLTMAQYLRQVKGKNIKIIFGGPQITNLYFKTKGEYTAELYKLANLIVTGEGEKPLLDFICKKTKQKIICFDQLKNIGDFNYIKGYKNINNNLYPKKQAMPLLFSRGCMRQCKFCSEKLLYRNLRIKKIETIISEIKYLQKEKGVKQFIFHDSMLNADLKELEKLCDMIIESFGSIPWEAQMGVRTDMSEELLFKIKKSGCYNLFIGLESGSDNTLKNMNKGFTAAQAKKFFKSLNKAGLFFGVSMIVGFPQETEEDLEESLKFLIDHKNIIPKIEQINPFVYYAGTAVDKNLGYRDNPEILAKTDYFISRLKQEKFKMTKAFLNNLVEKYKE
ncbi:MAG: B12-binding domain-containing radical SAM protein [Candidatus Omnitrophota bacterium]